MSHTIGIIGGADGPTAIFVTGRFPLEIPVLVIVCALAVVLFLKRKK